MKTLLALLIGAAALVIAAMTPASAQESVSLKCLVLGANQSVAYDVCRCAIVRIDAETKKLLRPNPIKIAALCPYVNNGGGGGQISDDSPSYPPHGHGFSFSKASSSSGVIGIAIGGSVPFATTILDEQTTSVAIGDGGSSAVAGSGGSSVATGSGPVAVARLSPTSSSSTSTTSGSTGGSSCAGNCGGGGGGGAPQ